MKKIIFVFFVISTLFLFGCAAHQPFDPGESGSLSCEEFANEQATTHTILSGWHNDSYYNTALKRCEERQHEKKITEMRRKVKELKEEIREERIRRKSKTNPGGER